MFTKISKKEILCNLGSMFYDIILFITWCIFAGIDTVKGKDTNAIISLMIAIFFALFIVGKGILFNIAIEIKHLNAKLDLIARQVGTNTTGNLNDEKAQEAYTNLLANENKDEELF